MTDTIHKQAQLNKLNERHVLLECRLSHLKEIEKEGFEWIEVDLCRDTSIALYASVTSQILAQTMKEIFYTLRQIRELEEAIEEQKMRMQ